MCLEDPALREQSLLSIACDKKDKEGGVGMVAPPEIFLWHPPACNDARLHKVLQRHVVDALSGEHHVRARVQHLPQP